MGKLTKQIEKKFEEARPVTTAVKAKFDEARGVLVLKDSRGRSHLVDPKTADAISRSLSPVARRFVETARRIVVVDGDILFKDGNDKVLHHEGLTMAAREAVNDNTGLVDEARDMIGGIPMRDLEATATTMASTSAVEHPPHYGGGADPYEAIKVIEAHGLNFNLGNALKYIIRAGGHTPKANPVEDLQKAAFYLRRDIDLRASTRPADVVREIVRTNAEREYDRLLTTQAFNTLHNETDNIENVGRGVLQKLGPKHPVSELLSAVMLGDNKRAFAAAAAMKKAAKKR